MPITDKQIPYEQMERIAESHICSCGDGLSIIWGGSYGYNGYILRCHDLQHNTIRPRGRYPEYLETEVAKVKSTQLMTMTKEQALKRLSLARFPRDLTVPEKELLATVTVEYGLDPIMGELMIYQGQPYVRLTGRLRKAQETDKLDGINTRPATDLEKKGRGYGPEDYYFLAQIWKRGCSKPFEGWAGVKVTEIEKAKAQARAHDRQEDSLPIVKDPAQHAEKRAIARGLKLGFSIPLPSAEDIGADDSPRVNRETGEIIEGEWEEHDYSGDDEASPSPVTDSGINVDWLKESIEKLARKIDGKPVSIWLNDEYHLEGKTVREILARMTLLQKGAFVKKVQGELDKASQAK